MSQSIQRPLPKPTADTQPYWDAAKEGRLTIQRCTACGEPQFYPRGFCVSCLSDDLEWIEASGHGSIYTFTVCHIPGHPSMADQVPYAIAMITLDEGVRMLAQIVKSDLEQVAVGAHVDVVFEPISPDFTLPQFKISSTGESNDN